MAQFLEIGGGQLGQQLGAVGLPVDRLVEPARQEGAISQPAWKTKPSWYLVSTDDRMIPPPAQRFMSKRAGAGVVEVKASHSVYVSKPEAVAALITQAAEGVRGAGAGRSAPGAALQPAEVRGSGGWGLRERRPRCEH